MDVQERVNIETLLGGGNKIVHLNLTTAAATYDMKVGDQIVFATSAAADGVAIVTLPSMVEAAGKVYYVEAPTGSTGGDISLYVKETATEFTTNGDMDADGDYLILFSSGKAWRTLVDGVA